MFSDGRIAAADAALAVFRSLDPDGSVLRQNLWVDVTDWWELALFSRA
ncbi:MAG: hypothetical protein IIC35_08780 [Gemmatimonadetes bacterium]|nr:hypothetical protein [Gemmatimonadota bacterium]